MMLDQKSIQSVRGAEFSNYTVETEDGLSLQLLRFCRKPCKNVVLLIHGWTSASNMYYFYGFDHLVNYLLDHGYTDVWCLDNRLSKLLDYNITKLNYSFDDVALYDYKPSLKIVRDHSMKNANIHVITHCVGSLTFSMALAAGIVTNIKSLICNAVCLTPRVSPWAAIKIKIFPFLLKYFTPYNFIDNLWGEKSGFSLGKLIAKIAHLFHRECKSSVCAMTFFMWGSGKDACFLHQNLNEETHEHISEIFGPVGNGIYHQHMKKLIAHSRALKFDQKNSKYAALPDDYLAAIAKRDVPLLLITGQHNKVFTDSNQYCFEQLERIRPNKQELKKYSSYGHQDIFIGKNAYRDVFPDLIEFMQRHS